MGSRLAEEVGLEDDVILSTLGESEHIASGLRAVFERDPSEREAFLEKLDQFIAQKERDIQTICSRHYEEFVFSIGELLTVRSDAEKLRTKIRHVNEEVQRAGAHVQEKASQLVDRRMVRHAISDAISIVQICQQVLTLLMKATQQKNDNKFYPALKTLEQLLQRVHIQSIQEFDFVKRVEKEAEAVTKEIGAKVIDVFNNWLVSVRDVSFLIGEHAMKQTKEARPQEHLEEQVKEHQKIIQKKRRKARERAVSEAPPAAVVEEFGEDESVFDKVRVDFSPVYQALYIHESMGMRNEFKTYYKENRKLQINLTLHPTVPPGEADQLWQYLSRVIGFFIVEDAVLRSTSALRTAAEVENLWDASLDKVKVILAQMVDPMTNHEQILKMKEVVVVFCHVAQRHSYGVSSLLEFLENVKEKMHTLLLQHGREQFTKIVRNDCGLYLEVESQGDYEKQVVAWGLADPKDPPTSFPHKLPFSCGCSRCCQILCNFVRDYFAFAKNVMDVDEAAIRATEELISDGLAKAIILFMDEAPILHISHAVQLSVDCMHWERACTHIESTIASLTRLKRTVHLTGARAALEHARTRAEDLTFVLINDKIDSMLSLSSNVNWAPNSPGEGSGEFIEDIISYLETLLSVLLFLPAAFREVILFTACKHISTSILDILASGSVKKVNLYAIYRLRKDVEKLEEFADRTHVSALSGCFLELHQLVILLLSEDLERVLNPEIRREEFSQLSMHRLTQVLDKIKEVPAMSGLGIPRLKKRTCEIVTKALRERR